jgi:hypothetical protein
VVFQCFTSICFNNLSLTHADAGERHCAPLALAADQFDPVRRHVWPPGMQADADA